MEYRTRVSNPNYPFIDKFRDLLYGQTEMLHQHGYEEMAFYGNMNLRRRIEIPLERAMNTAEKTGQPEELIVRIAGWDALAGDVKMFFHWQYRPQQEDVTLKSLTVIGAGFRRVLFVTKNTPLPIAEKLMSAIARERTRKHVRALFSKASSKKNRLPIKRVQK